MSEAANLRQVPRILQTYQKSSDYISAMLDRVNQERAAVGLSALCSNKKLLSSAQRHSDDMAAKDYMEHDGSDGSTMSERITQAGYDWSAVAENVAAGQADVDAVMDAWMNSPEHKVNILGDYTMLGTAYAYKKGNTYEHFWTQDFGSGDKEVIKWARAQLKPRFRRQPFT
uniref:SCP domain-containing protein n=1 Tax=Phytophthora ramorum TaxID=164328 RepID=H3HDK3_PHYRM